MIAPVAKVATFALRTINTPKRCAAAVVGLWVLCSLSYSLIEHQGPVAGLWWGIVTASTVGYGDYSPASTAGRFVGMVLIVGMWFLTLAAAALYTARAVEDRNAFTHEEQEEMQRVQRETLETVKRVESQQAAFQALVLAVIGTEASKVLSQAADHHRSTITMIQAHSMLTDRTAAGIKRHAHERAEDFARVPRPGQRQPDEPTAP